MHVLNACLAQLRMDLMLLAIYLGVSWQADDAANGIDATADLDTSRGGWPTGIVRKTCSSLVRVCEQQRFAAIAPGEG